MTKDRIEEQIKGTEEAGDFRAYPYLRALWEIALQLSKINQNNGLGKE
jgi:hypothetical protein